MLSFADSCALHPKIVRIDFPVGINKPSSQVQSLESRLLVAQYQLPSASCQLPSEIGHLLIASYEFLVASGYRALSATPACS